MNLSYDHFMKLLVAIGIAGLLLILLGFILTNYVFLIFGAVIIIGSWIAMSRVHQIKLSKAVLNSIVEVKKQLEEKQ